MMRFSPLIDWVLPPRCPISGDIVDEQGMLSADVWKELTFIDAPFCHACGLPFDFDTGGEESLCGVCLKELPVYRKARSALKYDDASREMILAYKHGDQTIMAISFLPFLLRAGSAMLEEAELIIPVPLHRWRLLRRRYNQAGLLATGLGRARAIPVLQEVLLRTRATPSQGHLKAEQRQKNVKNAFRVISKYAQAVKDKKILLIDDVHTTGSTASECAKVLLKAGAAQVDVLTLARVVRPERLA